MDNNFIDTLIHLISTDGRMHWKGMEAQFFTGIGIFYCNGKHKRQATSLILAHTNRITKVSLIFC